jgi:hypothetical protein
LLAMSCVGFLAKGGARGAVSRPPMAGAILR